jgi:hypothetical protein
MLGHTSRQDANVVSILSHERPHLSLPSKALLGGSWIFKFSNSSNPGTAFLLKLQTKVISGSGYLRKNSKDWLISSKNQLRNKGSG